MELNQNGQIEVDEYQSSPVLLSSKNPDSGAAVISIHEQTNGNIPHNKDTSIGANTTAEDLPNATIEVKEKGLNNAINADVTAVGLTHNWKCRRT